MYKWIIDKVAEGSRFSVDFKKRTLIIGSQKFMYEDLCEKDLGIEKYDDVDEWLDKLEDLYDEYKYSRPSATSMAKERRCKFKALAMDELVGELGHQALSNPKERDVAQAELEVFILFSLINGSLNPKEFFVKDWFYQGADKSLIVRKDWFI